MTIEDIVVLWAGSMAIFLISLIKLVSVLENILEELQNDKKK